MKVKNLLCMGIITLAAFVFWTILIQTIDVQAVGVNETDVGFATLNSRFHRLTGVNMSIYYITDWLGLLPLLCCMIFGGIGLVQLFKRKSLFKVDYDIIALGLYYLIVISGYLFFEVLPINYRPVLIDGRMESSYPSSTTLLVLSVMLTVIFQVHRRMKKPVVRKIILSAVVLFSLFMITGRTIAGVHWLTDIIGSLFFSVGLFLIYCGIVCHIDKNQEVYRGIQ